eukprot:9622782-Karenia_brevis.AAC.1
MAVRQVNSAKPGAFHDRKHACARAAGSFEQFQQKAKDVNKVYVQQLQKELKIALKKARRQKNFTFVELFPGAGRVPHYIACKAYALQFELLNGAQ